MIKIPIAIIGAGGMGGRHLRALGALYESGMANVELVAVCDKRKENAIYLADNAYEILGKRPKIFTSLDEMKSSMPEIEAVDITTDSGSHHLIAQKAFELEYNVLCEKPLSLTIKGCNKVIEAWKKSGKVVEMHPRRGHGKKWKTPGKSVEKITTKWKKKWKNAGKKWKSG